MSLSMSKSRQSWARERQLNPQPGGVIQCSTHVRSHTGLKMESRSQRQFVLCQLKAINLSDKNKQCVSVSDNLQFTPVPW